MRRLLFSVSGQSLRKEGNFAGVIAGTKGYLRCHFGMAEQDWLGAKKIALFNDQYPAAVNDAGECMVPDEVTDGKSIKVALIGQNGVTRIKTNPVLIEQGRA